MGAGLKNLLRAAGRLWCREREEGQSLVEFALVLPVLLVLLIGLIQFGGIFQGLIVLSSAAREGARAAAVGEDGAAAAGHVSQGALFIDRENVVVTIEPESHQAGDPVEVTVTAPVLILVPFIDPFDLTGRSTMRMEHLP